MEPMSAQAAVSLRAPNREPDTNTVGAQIGDWGRQGEHNQSDTAAAMAAVAALSQPHFVISTGDNFYPSAFV